mmetsp:Transcript_28645/g.50950  ORF Transcript_28645/g.50950 Transcript_28645/m.50950 type:complete len:333 (-) Transcript_28645:261-1259(-)
MAENPNFRQVGREAVGRVYRGTVADAYHRLSSASIPSKYELVLTQQTDVKEGFGTTAQRFDSSLLANPGPGYYNYVEPNASPSTSKQGYGALVSKSTRFKRFQFSNQVPGPGAYVQKKLASINKPSPMFIKKKQPASKPKAPAVGHYEPRLPTYTKAVTSSFISSSKRFEPEINKTNPSPGQYSPDVSLTRVNSAMLTSVFKPTGIVKKLQVNLYDPHLPIQENPVPGPGEYDLPSIFKSLDSSSSGLKLSDSNRFGESLNSKKVHSTSPGPGQYQLSKSVKKAAVSGSAFMSESLRFQLKPSSKPPGPAYYNPNYYSKNKSFLLNISGSWV